MMSESDAPRGFKRGFASRGYNWMVRTFLGSKLRDHQCGFKAFRRKALLKLMGKVKDEHWFWDTEIMTRAYYAGLRIKEVPAIFIKRPEKKSSVNIVADSFDYLVKLFRFQRIVRGRLKAQLDRRTTLP